MKKSIFAALLSIGFSAMLFGESASVPVGEFTFKADAPWTVAQNSGMMTKAVLAYPVENSQALEAKFYHFGSGQGGDVESNLHRWIKQFEGEPEVKREEIDVNGTKVVLLTATGTYLDGPPFGGTKTPRPNYQMLASIIVGKDAPVFIKLTGPKADTEKAAESFKKLSTSFGK